MIVVEIVNVFKSRSFFDSKNVNVKTSLQFSDFWSFGTHVLQLLQHEHLFVYIAHFYYSIFKAL